MAKIGYARVSSKSHTIIAQIHSGWLSHHTYHNVLSELML